MDQSNEKEPGSIDPSSRDCSSPDLAANGSLKSCTDCQTTKTPLWRGGPFGPKSLCNACGIRYRKKRREVLGVKERRIGGGEVGKESRKDGVSEKLRKALAAGSDSWKRRSAAVLQKQRRRLGEEEQAAVLLMSLSSGFLYAH